MTKIINFIKSETVLVISLILAVISAFFIKPQMQYLDYIDFRTLALLLSLMTVMKGFQEAGVFSHLAKLLLKLTSTLRQTATILTLLCFFTSMVITNDVALITFVPFSIEVLNRANQKKHIPFIVIMQTIAANLGSMLTPLGNPQNLYLYSVSEMSLGELFILMLPYAITSLILILICMLILKNATLTVSFDDNSSQPDKRSVFIYCMLFIISILTVMRIIHFIPTLIIVILTVLIYNKNVLKKVDYGLILTFIGFFIFVGNIGNIEFINSFLQKLTNNHEVLLSVASSQIISNVPAALLLSKFTDNYQALIIGTNLGGLGTLIASMASLISYKYISNSGFNKGKYLLSFTVFNIIFLAALLLVYLISH